MGKSFSENGLGLIFVSGTWKEDKAKPWADEALDLGVAIGRSGYDLTCGPGTGIARYVIDGFRSVPDRRGQVVYFLPAVRHMEEVGEAVEDGHDRIVETEFDYPMRNVFQASHSSAVVLLTGGDGALEEVLPAMIDYNLPVGVVRHSGRAARAVETLANSVFPEWNSRIHTADSAAKVWSAVLESLGRQG